jgi:uncharacterized protein involved in exopolysaccharide biosynthesis
MPDNIDKQEEAPFLIQAIWNSWVARYNYLRKSWKILVLMGIIGAVLGVGYAFIKKDTYTAATTFVVEDSKSSGGGIASALAGQFGLDLGGLAGGSGVLQGDNVLELLKSQALLKQALLTNYDSAKKISLADQYATEYGYTQKWANNSEIGRVIHFSEQNARVEDSLMHILMKRISEKELSISKPDKKLSLFLLQLTTRNEKISKMLCERLLKVTTDFYIDTKTKRIRGNVERLQTRVDSIKNLLNKKTSSAVEANSQLLDANPAFAQNREVNVEISGRDKMVQATIFAELTKNLEASKTALLQETPTIQVVDAPEFPLKKNDTSYLLSFIFGAVLLQALTAVYILMNRKEKF